MVKIGNASISEHGTINGTPGDQTGKEVYIRDWYNYPWDVVIRFNSAPFAEYVAECMEKACKNDLIGYGQSDRYGLWDATSNYSFDPSTVKKPVNCDCSSLVGVCIQYALNKLFPKVGVIDVLKWVTTWTIIDALKLSKLDIVQKLLLWNEDYRNDSKSLKRGDIILNIRNHVAVVTQGAHDIMPPQKPGIIEASTPAYMYGRYVSGEYIVNIENVPENFLMLRDAPNLDAEILVQLPPFEIVHNFGYYTDNQYGRWLYCMAYMGAQIYIGFVNDKYLRRKEK